MWANKGLGLNIIDLFSNNLFQLIILPAFILGLSFYFKIHSQNDKTFKIKREDFALGIEICIAALASLFTFSVSLIQKYFSFNNIPEYQSRVFNQITSNLIFLLALTIGTFFISSFIRWFGWDSQGKLKIFKGIIIPLIAGLSVFVFVVDLIRK